MHRYRDIRPLNYRDLETRVRSHKDRQSNAEKWIRKLSEMSVLQTGQRAQPVAVAVSAGRHLQHNVHMVLWMALSQITARQTGQIVDCD